MTKDYDGAMVGQGLSVVALKHTSQVLSENYLPGVGDSKEHSASLKDGGASHSPAL